jgi:hypothetical protein
VMGVGWAVFCHVSAAPKPGSPGHGVTLVRRSSVRPVPDWASGTHDRRLIPSHASLANALRPRQNREVSTGLAVPNQPVGTASHTGTPHGRTRRTDRLVRF